MRDVFEIVEYVEDTTNTVGIREVSNEFEALLEFIKSEDVPCKVCGYEDCDCPEDIDFGELVWEDD
jgi:hypothetical protein